MSDENGKTEINTGGGAYFGGDVTVEGDLIGRDQINVNGLNAEQVKELFSPIYGKIDGRPETDEEDKVDLKAEVEEIQAAAAKGDDVDESFLSRRLKNLGRMAPDILDVVVATLANPAAGFAVAVKKVADKVATSQ